MAEEGDASGVELVTSRVTSDDEYADYTLYFAPTPNGKKPALALEEMGLRYKIVPINIGQNDQFTDEFKAINPNSKIPVLVDHTVPGGMVIFESGAILEYLADKTCKFAPTLEKLADRYRMKQWLYWQMAGFGPMLGQMGFFWKYCKEEVPVGKERYLKEAIRLFTVLDTQLAENRFLTGEEYSIADMATYFWSFAPESYGMEDEFPEFEHVKRWQGEISVRVAVKAVNAIPFEW